MIGTPVARVDGYAKVTGGVRYTGDLEFPDAVHTALVLSTIASGRVVNIDETTARHVPGVIEILTYLNAGPMHPSGFLLLLQNETVFHAGQPIAMVLADTVARARQAAELVKVDYDELIAVTRIEDGPDRGYTPQTVQDGPAETSRGDVIHGLETAAVQLERKYTTPTHSHNPLEPHAAIASWDGDHLTIYATTSAVFRTRSAIAQALGVPQTSVRVVSAFLGGGFCSKGSAWWPVLLLVAVASRQLKRPVRLELRREEMFTLAGCRQQTVQTIRLGASREGSLTAVKHDTVAQTSAFGEYADPNGFPSRLLYTCPNVAVSHRLVRGNVPNPVAMRAPGEGTGTFALESAIDEIAYELHMDPLEFRIRNYAAFDQHTNKPWSSNGLKECYRVASEAFGWNFRPIEPGTLRRGSIQTGWGMATAYYPVFQAPASATVSMRADGTALARCGTQDIGTGTYTVIAQIVAETLQIPIERVQVEIGDTVLPEGPPSFGSMSASSFTPAVSRAAESLRSLLIAKKPGDVLEASGSAQQTQAAQQYSSNAYGAVFVEVQVDNDLGTVQVTRVTAAYAAGRILNARTARSQYIGGIVFGIGMALHEETRFDTNLGRIVNGNLADYLVPVHADVPNMDVHLIDETDKHLDNGGVKGIGMLGTVGVAAAIANAVFHASGQRVRELPIRHEHLLRRR